MRLFLNLVSLLLALVGAVWILQGANILPGSVMTGQTEWLLTGIVFVGIAIGIQVYMRRQSRS